MYTQRIVVKTFFFLFLGSTVHCFAAISWFISLNRIFIFLFNHNKFKCILPISYVILLKDASCAKQPLSGIV